MLYVYEGLIYMHNQNYVSLRNYQLIIVSVFVYYTIRRSTMYGTFHLKIDVALCVYEPSNLSLLLNVKLPTFGGKLG